MASKPKYQRVLLKLSGEVLCGKQGYGIDEKVLDGLAEELKEVAESGVELAIVIGGGNIYRGVSAASRGMDRATAYYMGMLATLLNALALQSALEAKGSYTRVLSAIEMQQLAEPYIRRRARRHLEKKRVVIFAGGTGNPFFTTDTAAALRAVEVSADVILKATRVDGIYDKDPLRYPEAKKYTQLTYSEVLQQELKVMDATATSLCKDNHMPMVVFDMTQRGNIRRAIMGENLGTVVGGK